MVSRRALGGTAYTLEGIDVLAFFSTVPNADWKVLASIPANEFSRIPPQAAALAAHRFANRAIVPIEYRGRSAEGLGNGAAWRSRSD